MLKNPKASRKKASGNKKKADKPAYLREIQIRYKKKRVKTGSPVGKRITAAQQVYELFSDLQNESKEKLIAISLDAKLKIICFAHPERFVRKIPVPPAIPDAAWINKPKPAPESEPVLH